MRLGTTVLKDREEILDPREWQGRMALWGQLACRGPQATLEQGATLDQEDHKDQQARLGSGAIQVPRAQMGRSGLRESMEIQV